MQAETKNNDQEVKHAQFSEFVSFTVAGQAFCLKITQIREIRRWSPVTPPVDSRNTMEYIQGIISHDDTMVRIINLDAVISVPEQVL